MILLYCFSDNIIVQYREWIKGGDYSSACINYTPIQTIASFLGRVNSIPLDLLRWVPLTSKVVYFDIIVTRKSTISNIVLLQINKSNCAG